MQYVAILFMVKPADNRSLIQIYDRQSGRFYLANEARTAFLIPSKGETRDNPIFCHVLHETGCRPTEALEFSAARISLDECNVVFRSLKKREFDLRGRKKDRVYREVPVSEETIDLTYDLKKSQNNQRTISKPLWEISRATAWRMIKRVMARAFIKGPQATCKGLRHGFGIALLVGEKPTPIHIVSQVLGHSDTKTTEFYLQATGIEKRQLVMQALEM